MSRFVPYTKILSLLLLLTYSSLSIGHDMKGHKRDMYRIFPFTEDQAIGENAVIDELYTLVNSYLDHKKIGENSGGHPDFIKNDSVFRTMTFGNHRIWYHWGFNGDFKRFQPLCDIVNSANISEDDKARFWRCLTKEVKKRNTALMNKAAEVFGYPRIHSDSLMEAQRDQLNGFVAILYDIHLLGDHQCKETDIILQVNDIYNDIYKSIEKLAGNYGDNIAKSKELIDKLKQRQHNPQMFLNEMEKEFSKFILSLDGDIYNYKNKFSDMGYVLKDPTDTGIN